MASGLPPVGARPRVGIRDARGAARRRGDVEVTPVARVYAAHLGGGRLTAGAWFARPHRVEVRRDGVPHGSVRVPDWNLRIVAGCVVVVVVAWIIGRSRP